MPRGPDRRPLSRIRAVAVVIALGPLSIVLPGCSTGDFGRARNDVLNEDMHRWVGVEAIQSTGRRASDFQLTDSERSLRNQAYAFIEPPHSRSLWKGVFGEYDPIAAPWHQGYRFDRTMYGRHLIDEPHLSHASRYAQVIDDARNDTQRLDRFFATAAQVADLDQKRDASLKYITDLSPRERADAQARMKENALIVQWVGECLRQRVAGYHWALERLVVQGPDAKAADADRLIGDLSARVDAALQHTPVVAQVLTVKG
jgi:hypothetical protein